MPRLPRPIGQDVSYHVIARCNNEEFLFQSSQDFQMYLHCLEETMEQYPFELNNFTLMSSHVHLMITTRGSSGIDRVIHHSHTTFAKRYNQKHHRKGHFWAQRYKSLVIDNDTYGLACMRYINRNPIRAGLVKKAEEWPWSAYRFYAFAEPSTLITPFPSFLGLHCRPRGRQEVYRKLVAWESEKEQEEKRFFSGKFEGHSRRFERTFRRVIKPLILDHQVPGTWWSLE